jgi:hypothetical protein
MITKNSELFIEISYLHNHSRQIKLYVHVLNRIRLNKQEKPGSSLGFVSILKDHMVFYYKPIINNPSLISIYNTTYFDTSNTDLELAISTKYDIYNYYKKNKSGLYRSLRFNFEGRNYKADFVMLSEDQKPIKILELSRMYTKGLFTGNPNC